MYAYRILTLVVLGLFSVFVHAQVPMQTGITWNDPTTYLDGSPLPQEEIKERRLLCGLDGTAYPMSMVAPAGGLLPKEDIVATFSLGYATTYFCVMTITAMNDNTSGHSEQVSFFLEDVRVPMPPTIAVE